MKSLRLRRIGALLLGLGLLNGLEAKAYGLAMCPMHQAAQKDGAPGHHLHHTAPGHAKSVCNCVDACQTGCASAIIKTGAPRLVLAAPEACLGQNDPAVAAIPSLRAHFLPFATAPPSRS